MEQEVSKVEKSWCPNKPKILTVIWLLIQVIVICLIASAFSVGDNAAYIFLAVFVSLLAIFFSCAGTIILRKYRTPYHHGFLVGVAFMMSMIMLLNSVASGTRDPQSTATAAVLAFSIFLFVLYLVFGSLLVRWREDIIGIEEEDIDEDDGAGATSRESQAINGASREEETDLKMV